MTNPKCQLCGDDCSPSLSNRGWCIYCEKAYKMGKKKVFDDIDKVITPYATLTQGYPLDRIDLEKYEELKQRHLSTFSKKKKGHNSANIKQN